MTTKTRRRLGLLAAALIALTLAPAAAHAQDVKGLPLPDVIFYGNASRNGEDVESGTVKVRLPDGTVLSADIGEIAGVDDYTWVLAVPLRMYINPAGPFEDGTVRRGETLTFFVDNEPALFTNPTNMQTTAEFQIPNDANGETYVLDLEVREPDGYPLGDVNLSGRRDSADGLLVLRYDIGLMSGTEDFPPGPGRIYLPLCDMTGDGQCNSSDALRILQCDAMIAGVSCPNDQFVLAAGERSTPSADAGLVLATELVDGARSGEVTLRMTARDSREQVAAIAAELHYDPAVFAIETCQADPEAMLDVGLCNAEYAEGVLRLDAVAAEGLAGMEIVVAEITLRAIDPDALDAILADANGVPASLLGIAAEGAFDGNGEPLPWRVEGLLLVPGANALGAAVDRVTMAGKARAAEAAIDLSSEAGTLIPGRPEEPIEVVGTVYLPLVGWVTGE